MSLDYHIDISLNSESCSPALLSLANPLLFSLGLQMCSKASWSTL